LIRPINPDETYQTQIGLWISSEPSPETLQIV